MNTSDKNKLENAYGVSSQSVDTQDVVRDREYQPTVLLVKITGATPMPSAVNRWIYTWSLAEVGPTTLGNGYQFTQRSGETWYTGEALNVIEAANTAGFIGPGIDPANIPAGFSVQPVQGFVLIWSQNRYIRQGSGGEVVWLFCVPNAIDGQCSTPLTDGGIYFGES